MSANESEPLTVGDPNSPASSHDAGSGLPPERTLVQGPFDPGDDSRPPSIPEVKKDTVHAADDPTGIAPKVPVHEGDQPQEPAGNQNGVEQSTILGAAAGLMETENWPSGTSPLDDFEQTFIYAKFDTGDTESELLKDVGPYRVSGELGRGGMGVVYKAQHKQLFREVALKMVLKAAGADRETLSRFQVEAQAIATLKHPGIVQIYEYGEERGIPWFALEFVDGKTLSQIAKDPLEPRRAAKIVADLASAVAYAHHQGVLHRDIKPGNVLIAAGDTAKLTDFGLAKRVSTEDSNSDHHTIDGQVMGTPSYMPPEQARGATELVGPHSDQYSLGATLYHLLAGRAPFVGPRPIEVLWQVIGREPVSVRQLQPDTPIDLDTICMKAMSKEPARRYLDCAAFEEDLRRFLRQEPILARPIGSIERTIRWCRRNPKVATPIAIAVISTLMALSISVNSSFALAKKNEDIKVERDLAVKAKDLADENKKTADINAEQARLNAEEAKKNATEAEENAKLAYQRAIQAKNSIVEMLSGIRQLNPRDEQVHRVRESLLRTAFKELESLPDSASDIVLATGLQKVRLHEEMYRTALDLGEPSKAVVPLENAERTLRERNDEQHTDATRMNLARALTQHAMLRTTIERDMQKVIEYKDEITTLLDDILANPNPKEFDINRGSVPRIDTLGQVVIEGYQKSLYLMKLGRNKEAFSTLNRAIARFDEILTDLRQGFFKNLTEEQWIEQIGNIRGKMSDQDLLHAILLCSIGKNQEATEEQSRVLAQLRRVDAFSRDPDDKWKLAYGLMLSGDLAIRQGRNDDALDAFAECRNIFGEFFKIQSYLESRRNDLHVSLMRLGGVLRSKDLPAARKLYSTARSLAEEMIKLDDQAITKHVALALVLPFSGPPAEAAALAEKILRTCPHQDAEMNVDMARVYAASAEAEAQSTAPSVESIMQWKQRAMTLLSSAYDMGYRDGPYLAGEPDLSSLRSDEEFKALIAKCNDEFKSQ